MWSRSLTSLSAFSSLLRHFPQCSAMSTGSGFEGPFPMSPGAGSPWILTVPELQPNSQSHHLLPWKRQIPMTVRYNIPLVTPNKRIPDYSPPVIPATNRIMTPNGLLSWSSIACPSEEKSGLIRDPGVNKVTYKYYMRKSRHKINYGRPEPQILQRIRRKRRRKQLLWVKYKIQRRQLIDKKNARLFIDEKKRIDSSDWWDWYITYDNPPKQF